MPFSRRGVEPAATHCRQLLSQPAVSQAEGRSGRRRVMKLEGKIIVIALADMDVEDCGKW